MDFKPFEPPPTDHHGLATGLTTEGGVSAKGFVEGVNEAFQHLFGMIKSDEASREADRITALQNRNDELEANVNKLLASLAMLTGQVNHIESAASDMAFKVDALERRLNEAPKPADPAPQIT